MKTLYQFNISLTLQGPILTKATSPSSFGIDAAVARDFEQGKPMIPGTLVEGRIRESLLQLNEGHPTELFGRETKVDTDNEPQRGTLLIGDLIATKPCTERSHDSAVVVANEQANAHASRTLDEPVPFLSRTALDSTLGTAKAESLRVIETPFQAGDKVTFKGTAEMFCKDEPEAKETARLLQMGLLWQTQFGAYRSTGFGKVISADVTQSPIPQQPESISFDILALDLAIRPRGPLCIAKPKIGDNLFESETIIPGNMLAGAVMQTAVALGIQSGFDGQFDKIRFSHSFPTTSARRPRALPLSTVKAGAIPYDTSRFRDPVRLTDDKGNFVSPAFPTDWKRFDDALGKLDWADPARELRVRTAIDSENRKAADTQLFAWELIHPFLNDKNHTPVIWRTRIDLSRVDDATRPKVAETLAKALAHLSFVSKTKTRCQVAVTSVSKSPEVPEIKQGETLALVLQTHAMLADPRFQPVPGVPKSGAISAADMLKLYQSVWSELSGDSLTLSHHFAQQHLEGGNYLGIRFQKKHDRPYNPWLLTDVGSVFVFTVKDAAIATQKLTDWLTSGLPVPAWAKIPFGENWDQNPYRPDNGFGEIAVHKPEFATPQVQSITLADPILPQLQPSTP